MAHEEMLPAFAAAAQNDVKTLKQIALEGIVDAWLQNIGAGHVVFPQDSAFFTHILKYCWKIVICLILCGFFCSLLNSSIFFPVGNRSIACVDMFCS